MKYLSCHSIQGELFFNHLNKIGYCCMVTPTGGQPVLYENYCGELIDWEKFFFKRDEHIKLIKNGGNLKACEGCFWIRESDWITPNKSFNYILLNMWTKCNLFCIYCSNHSDMNVINNTKEYDIVPVIKDMINKKVVTENTKIEIAGGEASIYENFNELIDVLIESGIKNININTNATIFSSVIEKGIKKGVVSVISSIDAGDWKKFEFIKKKNLWNTVWENLNRYSLALKCDKNEVKTKYIILPDVNDTKDDIKAFIEKSKETKVSGVILNIDFNWLNKNSQNMEKMLHIIELSDFFINTSNEFNIKYQIWAHLEDLIKRYNLLAREC